MLQSIAIDVVLILTDKTFSKDCLKRQTISTHGVFDINSSIIPSASSQVAQVSFKSSVVTIDQTIL